jgi:hypothetical protein
VKGKAPESTHYIVSHYNIKVTKDFFNTSFDSWRYTWLIDIGSTYHMAFQRYFFKYFNENVDGIVYFVDKSSLKPLGIGTIMLKMLGLLNFIMHDVLHIF